MDDFPTRKLSRAMSTRKRVSGATKSPLKISVLGALGVGKTAIVVRFVTKRFFSCYNCSYDHSPYIVNSIPLDDQVQDLEVFDFCGKDILKRLQTDGAFRDNILKSDGILLVFTITDPNTLVIAKTVHQILATCSKTKKQGLPPILLVANMKDLSHFRQVSRSEAQQYALKHSEMSFRECSASESVTDVEEAFHELIRMMQQNAERQIIRKERKESRKNSVGWGSPKLIRAGIRRISVFGKLSNSPVSRAQS